MHTQTSNTTDTQNAKYPTSYREMEIGKTLYRVTSVYKGEIKLKDALEELAVKRALREAMSETGSI